MSVSCASDIPPPEIVAQVSIVQTGTFLSGFIGSGPATGALSGQYWNLEGLLDCGEICCSRTSIAGDIGGPIIQETVAAFLSIVVQCVPAPGLGCDVVYSGYLERQ
jgi:hypothetical protein